MIKLLRNITLEKLLWNITVEGGLAIAWYFAIFSSERMAGIAGLLYGAVLAGWGVYITLKRFRKR